MHKRHLLSLIFGFLLVWLVHSFAVGSDAVATPITVAWRQPYNANFVAVIPTPTIDAALKQQADQLKEEGNDAAQTGDLPSAQRAYQAALRLYRQAHDRDGEARALYNLGSIYATDWDPTFTDYLQALASFQQALTIWRDLADPLWEARTRYNIGWVYAQMGNSEQAITHFDEALTLLADLHDPLETGNALVIIATGYDALKAYEEAIDAYQQALSIFQSAGENAKVGIILQALGQVLHDSGDDRQAIIYLTEARQRFQQNGDRWNAAMTAKFMGLIYVGMGDYPNALIAYQDAVDLLQQSREWVEVAVIQRLLGDVFNSLGEYYQALVQYDAALTFWRETDVPEREDEAAQTAELLGVKGQLYLQLGDYAQAEAAHTEAHRIWQQLGESAHEATALRELGFLAALLEQYAGAFRYYEQALTLWKTLDDRAGEAQILTDMGIAADWQGKPRAALTYLNQALPLWQAEENSVQIVRVLNKLSFVYGELWLTQQLQPEERTLLQQHRLAAAGYVATLKDPDYKVIALSRLGLVHTLLGDAKRAAHSYTEALTLAETLQDRALQAAVLESIGINEEFLGNIDRAIENYQRAIAILETIRGNIKVEELKSTFAADARQVDIYQRVIRLLEQAKRPAEAFDYAERARSRAFLDQVGGQTIRNHDNSAVQLVEAELVLRQQLVQWEQALGVERAKPEEQQDQAQLAQWRRELEEGQRHYSTLLTDLKVSNPEYVTMVSVDPLTLADVQRHVLDEQTTLIAYFVLEDRTLAWVVDRRQAELVELPVTREELENWQRNLYNTLSTPSLREEIDGIQPILATLYDHLFAPLQSQIHHRNVVIVPHNVLHYLPFAALWNETETAYLLEQYTITYAPSASALQYIQAKQNVNDARLLALGNPDGSLDAAEREVNAIAGLFGTRALIGRRATESAVYNNLADIDILY